MSLRTSLLSSVSFSASVSMLLCLALALALGITPINSKVYIGHYRWYLLCHVYFYWRDQITLVKNLSNNIVLLEVIVHSLKRLLSLQLPLLQAFTSTNDCVFRELHKRQWIIAEKIPFYSKLLFFFAFISPFWQYYITPFSFEINCEFPSKFFTSNHLKISCDISAMKRNN